MIITITRYHKNKETIDGRLTIDGDYPLCDTAENVSHALPAGIYTIRISKCKFHVRKMPVVNIDAYSSYEFQCYECHGSCVGLNSTPLKEDEVLYCPQLCPGNGAYNRKDGAILIGTHIAPGCLVHPKEAFTNVYDRIRKSAERGHELLLKIVEAYPLEKKVPHTLYEACEDWLQRVSTQSQKLLPAPTI